MTNSNSTYLDSPFFWSNFGAKCLFGVLYLMAIVHAKMGSKYTFVYAVAGVLMAGEFGSAAGQFFLTYRGLAKSLPFLTFLSETFFYATFNIGHWIFARKYYLIAYEIPFVINEDPVPKDTCLHKSAVNITFMVLSVLLAGVFGTIAFGTNAIQTPAYIGCAALLFISGLVLLKAV